MESSIAGLLILSVLIVAVVLMSQAYVASNTLLGTALVESVTLAIEREDTSLSIESWGFATSTPKELTIEVENAGSTSIADYGKMDVFVNDERLEFATSTPSDGTWTLSDRTIWRPGTTRDIRIIANAEMAPGSIVVMSSPVGRAETGALPSPTPTTAPFSVTCKNATTTSQNQWVASECTTTTP